MIYFYAILLKNSLMSQNFEAQSIGRKLWGANYKVQSVKAQSVEAQSMGPQSAGAQSAGGKVWGCKIRQRKVGSQFWRYP